MFFFVQNLCIFAQPSIVGSGVNANAGTDADADADTGASRFIKNILLGCTDA